MKIKQFRYSADNLSYLVYGKSTALAIDPGASGAILRFLREKNLTLTYVANTHMHPDHTPGNRDILEHSQAEYLDNSRLRQISSILLDNEEITVFHTPGHSEDSLTFHAGDALITGDTLFNGTVGNCFSGDLEGFFQSIKRIFNHPLNTVVYAGHDYVRDAIAVAENIEPDNPDIRIFLKKYDPYHVYSTLDDELKVNPYVRYNDPRIISLLKKRGLPSVTEYQRWKALMQTY